MVEMFGIDIGHDRDGAVQSQEAAVALVGFDHHPVGLANPRVRAIRVDDPAINDCRIDPTRVEQFRNEAGRSRLAVRARNRNGRFEAHQLGEHLGAADHRDAARVGRFNFGIGLAADGGRGHDHRRLAEIPRFMADRDGNTLGAQAFDDIALGDVGPLHTVTEIVHHLGDARHADPANADEVDDADIGGNTLHAAAPATQSPRAHC